MQIVCIDVIKERIAVWSVWTAVKRFHRGPKEVLKNSSEDQIQWIWFMKPGRIFKIAGESWELRLSVNQIHEARRIRTLAATQSACKYPCWYSSLFAGASFECGTRVSTTGKLARTGFCKTVFEMNACKARLNEIFKKILCINFIL